MTYLTHRRFAVWMAIVGCMYMYTKGMQNINYYLALIITIQFSKLGGLFPDVDHHWQNVKDKNAVNWVINKLIHITGGKHRSWQTHSIDITILYTILSFILPNMLLEKQIIGAVDKEILGVIMVGFALGWLSHIIADMLNGTGVRLFCWNKKHIALVPHSLFGLKFKTGESWEGFVSTTTQVLNIIVGIISIMYPYILLRL